MVIHRKRRALPAPRRSLQRRQLAWVVSMVAMSAAMSTLAMVAAPAPSEFLQAET